MDVGRAHAHLTSQPPQTRGTLKCRVGRDVDGGWVSSPSIIRGCVGRNVKLGLRTRGVRNYGAFVRQGGGGSGGRGRGDIHSGLTAAEASTSD